MTKARSISRILSSEQVTGDINISGIVTAATVSATTFTGDGTGLTGLGTGDVSTSSLVVIGISTLQNVTAGVATANQFSGSITGTAATFTGAVTAASFSDANGNIKGVGIATAGGTVGTGVTLLDFRNSGVSTVTVSSGIATLQITGGGGGSSGVNVISYYLF